MEGVGGGTDLVDKIRIGEEGANLGGGGIKWRLF